MFMHQAHARCLQNLEEGVRSLKLELQMVVNWMVNGVLGLELRYSRRTVSAIYLCSP